MDTPPLSVRIDRGRSRLRVIAERREPCPSLVVEAVYSGGPDGIWFRLHQDGRIRVFSRDEVARHPALSAMLRLIGDEAESAREPNQELLGWLFQALQIYVARVSVGDPLPRWGRPFRHPQIERALGLLNEHIEKRWTVTLLARAVGLSRPVFARRFAEAVGLSPMRYLGDRRMRIAAALLLDSDAALAEVARRVGYDSEFAFSRAFKRYHREPPGSWRRARVGPPDRTASINTLAPFPADRPRCAA